MTCSPKSNLKFSCMKLFMENKKYTHKWFLQCHPFYCSDSHSDYKTITNQFVCLVLPNLKKELRELPTANKWHLKLPNTCPAIADWEPPSTHGFYLCKNACNESKIQVGHAMLKSFKEKVKELLGRAIRTKETSINKQNKTPSANPSPPKNPPLPTN